MLQGLKSLYPQTRFSYGLQGWLESGAQRCVVREMEQAHEEVLLSGELDP